jgi:hypothetical protein
VREGEAPARRAALRLPQSDRDRPCNGLERQGLPGGDPHDVRREYIRDRRAADRKRDHRDARSLRPPQHRDVLVAGFRGEHVDVDVRPLGISEAHRSGIGAAAKQLLPQQGRQLVGASHREDVLNPS